MDAFYRVIASVLLGMMSALGIQTPPATWQMQVMLDGRSVAITFSDHPHSSHSLTVPVDQFDGLKPLLAASGPAKFRLKRDAGVVEFDGVLRGGAGGGTLEFVPSETFPIELARRGFARPTRVELLKMAWSDTGFAFIDELAAQKYARPSLQELVNGADHGVTREFVREMSGLGYRLGTVDALVRQRDHGVGPQFIRDLQGQSLSSLTADDLVRARDHGVSPEYVKELRQLGYQVRLAECIAARDHGVDAEYAGAIMSAGYQRPSIAELIQLRDHGITPQYARAMQKRGGHPPIDRLVQMHDRGER